MAFGNSTTVFFRDNFQASSSDSLWPETQLSTVQFTTSLEEDLNLSGYGIDIPPILDTAVVKRRAEFVAGRICARHALYQLLSIDTVPEIGASGQPVWPLNVTGSISHCAGIAVAAVSSLRDYQSLGIDIENVLDVQNADNLMDLVMTRGEQQRWLPSNDFHPALVASLIFSLKESVFKALFPITETHFYFNDAEVIHLDPNGQATICLTVDLSGNWIKGSLLTGRFSFFRHRILTMVAVEA